MEERARCHHSILLEHHPVFHDELHIPQRIDLMAVTCANADGEPTMNMQSSESADRVGFFMVVAPILSSLRLRHHAGERGLVLLWIPTCSGAQPPGAG